MDIIKASLMAAVSQGGGANLGTKTITANGTYTAQTDGYDGYSSVTVIVPTYEEEYEEMLECCEEVKEKLKELDPDYNPDDPDAPTIPEEIDKVSGYTVPEGVNPTDPAYQGLIGGNPVTDETLGLTVAPVIMQGGEWVALTTTRIERPPNTSATFGMRATDSNGTTYYGASTFGLITDGEYIELLGYNVSNGTVTLSYKYHVAVYGGWDDRYPTDTFQWAAVSTYGDTSHTYKVRN